MTRGAQLRADLLAGLTVALVGLPQCLAYAMMSGLPPAYGIATAAVPGLVAALAGRSAQIVTGPTNTTGLLILSALVPFLGANGLIGREALPALATLTLLAGAIRLLLGYAGGASLLRFLPESVLVGFTAGAGVLIATMQLDEALGLPPVSRTGLLGELEAIVEYFRSGVFPAPAALVVTAVIVLALSLGRRFLRRGPTALLALAAVTALAWFFQWDASSGLPLVADRTPVPGGWPETALPALRFDLLQQFFVPALAITLLGTLELAVSAKARGARPDMKREILAQGFANVAGSFAGSFPASASLTRSALLAFGGARTRLAAGSAAVLVVPILVFAAPSLAHIPQAALAGILFVTAYGMIDKEAMRRMWRATPATRALLVVTLGSALLLPLEWAILVGAGLGLVIHLARTSIPRIRLLEPRGPNVERLVPISKESSPEVVVLEVSGDLHYAAVEPFLAEAENRLPKTARTVVMDLTHAHEMRFTALVALERFADDLEARSVRLYLAGVPADVLEMMEASGSHLSATGAEAEPLLSVRNCIQSVGVRSPQES
jgi:SulP family sulfate permease